MLNGGGPPPTGEERKGAGRSSIGESGCLIAGSIPPLPSGTPDNALATKKDDNHDNIKILAVQ